jgi:hypothetical protein
MSATNLCMATASRGKWAADALERAGERTGKDSRRSKWNSGIGDGQCGMRRGGDSPSMGWGYARGGWVEETDISKTEVFWRAG